MNEIPINPFLQKGLDLVRQRRRELGRLSLLAFAQINLGHHFVLSPSEMHKEIAALLEEITQKRGGRVAIAAPRGHAKSTLVSLIYVLWCVMYDREKFIVLISDTGGQAEDLLSHVKHELESNTLLQGDFPGACERPGAKPAPERRRADEVVTRNGVRIAALGAGKKIRGRRFQQHRPGLIILDDVENEEQASSADRRDKTIRWLQRAVLKAGDLETNVVVLGTILHYESALATLIDKDKSPGWAGRKYQAVLSWATRADLWERYEGIYCLNGEFEGKSGPEAAKAFYRANEAAMLEGAKALWPEKENYYDLMALRLADGRASFDSEKMNEPLDPKECLFKEEDFKFWDNQFASDEDLLKSLGEYEVYGACDPSLGKAGKARDDSAIITLVLCRATQNLYVLDADIRKRTPDQIIQDLIMYQDRRKYQRVVMETNQFQEFLADELVKRGHRQGTSVPVEKLHQTSDKLGRIQSLEPKVHTGQILFSKRHRLLLDQLRQFPKAAHDDGPDALEMAVAAATMVRPRITTRMSHELPPSGFVIRGDGPMADMADRLFR